ncbi:MAG: hypothetical protein KGJ13_05650, partial [Patescibacteria group bacterium]|nr:hypothetical protein [Patescibacteria group bacterium]
MAAYPPGPTRMVDLSPYGANSAPTDRFWIASAAVGFAAGSAADRYITPNDFLAEITRNVSDVTLQFGDGAASTVSAASKGKLRYNNTTTTYQVSLSGAAYTNLLTGSGAATRVAFWSGTAALSSNANFYWDNTNARLGVGVGSTPGLPIDVAADATALAQQWRENGAGTARVQMQVPSSFGQLGTTSNHDFGLITNSIQRVNVEKGGSSVFGSIVPATGTVMVNALLNTDVSLVANNFAGSTIDIAKFQLSGSNRFRFLSTGEATFGLASTVDGKLTFASAGAAFTQSLQAGTAPAATNSFRWPNASPTAGQALSASAPAAGIVTLSWSSFITGPASPDTSVQFADAGAFAGNANFVYDKTNNRLGLGITLAASVTTLNVRADSNAVAQEWRSNTLADTTRTQMQVTSSDARIGMSSAHAFYLITNSIQRVSVESGGAVAINRTSPAQAQLHVDAATNITTAFLANNFTGTSVDIAIFQVNGSNRARITQNGEVILGLASTQTGKLTLSNSSGATLTSISAGNAATTLNFIWPIVDPTAGQVLSAAAPSGGNVVLSWATGGGGTPSSPTNSLQYNNAGAFGGNSGLLYIPGSTTGNELALASSTITGGNLFSIAMTGTAA